MILYIKLYINDEYAEICKTSIVSNDANTIVTLLDKAIIQGLIVDEIVNGDLLIEFGDDRGDLTVDPIGLTPLFTYPMFDQWNCNVIRPKKLPTFPDLIDFIITKLR